MNDTESVRRFLTFAVATDNVHRPSLLPRQKKSLGGSFGSGLMIGLFIGFSSGILFILETQAIVKF